MTGVDITVDASRALDIIVRLDKAVSNPIKLNEALGQTLATTLQRHFLARNKEPNKMGAPKTNFWLDVSQSTAKTSADALGAVVTIGEDRYRIQLHGGRIRPTGGRKFLTIPLIKEARGKRVREYEQQVRKRLFRIGGALFERSGSGDQSLVRSTQISTRGRNGGSRSLSIRGRSQIRAVYALKGSVVIKPDARALPNDETLINALTAAVMDYVAAETTTEGGEA